MPASAVLLGSTSSTVVRSQEADLAFSVQSSARPCVRERDQISVARCRCQRPGGFVGLTEPRRTRTVWTRGEGRRLSPWEITGKPLVGCGRRVVNQLGSRILRAKLPEKKRNVILETVCTK